MEKTEVDERLEPLKKMLSLNSEQLDLIANRNAKEAEFKAFLREQDKAIEEINQRQRVLAKMLVEADVKKMGHVSDELKGCLEGLGIKLDGDRLAADKEIKVIHTENYKGFISGNKPDVKARVVYGDSIDEVLDKAALADNDGTYTTVNIGGLNKSEGQYRDYRKFDLARRYDVSPVYLSLPYLDKDEFAELTKKIKTEGAKFNTYNKSWYIPPELASKEVFQPYISELPRQRDYARQRHYTSQELALPVGQTGKTVNDMLSRNDGYVRITYEDNGRGRITPKAEFLTNDMAAENKQSGRWLSDSKVRTLIIGGHEMNKDVLYPGEGYQIEPEHEIVKSVPSAAVVCEEDASGKFYSIYGIHDISGMIYRLSPRRFDTPAQAQDNIPDNHKMVTLDELKKEHTLYADVWSQLIKDDMRASGYEASDYIIKNIKLLNFDTNKSWSLKEISDVYKMSDGRKPPEKYDYLSDRAMALISKVGDECANLQRMEIQTAEIVQ